MNTAALGINSQNSPIGLERSSYGMISSGALEAGGSFRHASSRAFELTVQGAAAMLSQGRSVGVGPQLGAGGLERSPHTLVGGLENSRGGESFTNEAEMRSTFFNIRTEVGGLG